MVPVKESFKGAGMLELPLSSSLGGRGRKPGEEASPPGRASGLTLYHCSRAAHLPALSPGVAGRGSNAHSKGAKTKIDRQANRSNMTLQREEKPQDEAVWHSGPQTRGTQRLLPAQGSAASDSQPRALGMVFRDHMTSYCILREHSEGLISAFNMQIRAWAD